MKTNIKLRVTPEQSEAVQKICFANGINWNMKKDKVQHTDLEYLFIESNIIWGRNTYDHNLGSETLGYTEVDADLFIRTNGTCEKFTCKHPGVNNTTGKCIACGEYIDKSDFEPNIQSSTLSSEQLRLFRAGQNFEIPNYLAEDPDKLLKELNSELMQATKTTSINLKLECPFAKYGFEVPDFNCIILAKVGSWLIGYTQKGSMAPVPAMWFEHTGESSGSSNLKVPNLTPIKQPWYETCKFPMLVWDIFANKLEVATEYTNNVLYLLSNIRDPSEVRPLTNAEIDQLKQDF